MRHWLLTKATKNVISFILYLAQRDSVKPHLLGATSRSTLHHPSRERNQAKKIK
jgi:hypothetical protein